MRLTILVVLLWFVLASYISTAFAADATEGCQWHVKRIAWLESPERATNDFAVWLTRNPDTEQWYIDLVRAMIDAYYQQGPDVAFVVCVQLANGHI